MRYTFIADFAASVLITPDHDRAVLLFSASNLDGLEQATVEFDAAEVDERRLDELARWIVGEPNRFLDGGHGLRRLPA